MCHPFRIMLMHEHIYRYTFFSGRGLLCGYGKLFFACQGKIRRLGDGMELKKKLIAVLIVLSVMACVFAEGGSETTHIDKSAAFSKNANPNITSKALATALSNWEITENVMGTEKWNRMSNWVKNFSSSTSLLPVYPGATITITPQAIQKRSSYDGSYYTYFDENDIIYLIYNPEYLSLQNTGAAVVNGDGYFDYYDKETVRMVLESHSSKINENRNIAALNFNTPVVLKVIKESVPGDSPELTVFSLVPKSRFRNTFGTPFDLGVVVLPFSKTVEMEQEQTSRLYAPWISNTISVTDDRDINYSSYVITNGNNKFNAGVKNLTTTSRRYTLSLDIDTDCEGLTLVASDKAAFTTSSSEINNSFTLKYTGDKSGTALITMKIIDEEEGVVYTYSKEYVVEPSHNRDFLILNDIEVATNGNKKLGALTNTSVYLDASLDAISVEDRCSYVLVQVFDNAGNNKLSSKISLNTDNKSLKGTLGGGWGNSSTFSRLNSSLSFTPTQAGTYTVYAYAFDGNGFLLGKWFNRILIE